MSTVSGIEMSTVSGIEMSVDRYCEVRSWTERLAAPLSAEDQTVQSMPDTSPTKWHRAHTSWFFETFILGPHGPGYEVFDASYGYLFNSYYETIGARFPRPQRGVVTRPGIEEVAAYRRHVDRAMVELLSSGSTGGSEALVELGLHHEQQHQELVLMDIKHVLSLNPSRPVYVPEPPPRLRAPGGGSWLEMSGGVVEVGADGAPFCFDNEMPRHERLLRPFGIARSLVSCAEWRAFMADGGYERPELWMSDGWALARAEGWKAPLYWHPDATTLFTLHGERALDPAEPVCHVSWYEADAFARWAGARLPDEAEWEVAAPEPPSPGAGPGEVARHAHPGEAGADDPGQWYAGVWQWTASSYHAYPGFRPPDGAVGEYNAKFMVNQHVLRGSSCATPPGHARRSYRNFFPPGARWPFTGVRLARDGG